MNRRTFLKYLLATPLAATVDYEQLLWIPNQQIVVPDLTKYPALYGMTYHYNNGTTATWLGLIRDDKFWKALKSDKRNIISSREMKVPLKFEI